MTSRLVVYDTESSGVDKDYDQIYQLAAIEIDSELNIIEGSEVNLLCKPKRDVVPSPEAFLVHHISMDILKSEGMSEYELAKAARRLMLASPNTGIMGYNNMAYDDEMLRRLMFRNGLPPYEHEYNSGNYRLDAFNLVKLAYAYRPEILEWPVDPETGKVKMKLEGLSSSNGLTHENAHEALSDVVATIELAQLVRSRCRGLWDHFVNLSSKDYCKSLLNRQKPMLLTDNFISRDFRHTSLVLPVIAHPTNRNGYLSVDLRHDPSELLSLSTEEIRKYMFTKRHELEENAPYLPAKNITANKQPGLVDPSEKLTDAFAESISLDIGLCEKHMKMIQGNNAFRKRLQDAFLQEMNRSPDEAATIYTGGFLSRPDDAKLQSAHMKDTNILPDQQLPRVATHKVSDVLAGMQDGKRQFEIMTRARWNNFASEILKNRGSIPVSPNEIAYYSKYLQARLYSAGKFENGISIQQAREQIGSIKLERALDNEQLEILKNVSDHLDLMESTAQTFQNYADKLAPVAEISLERENSATLAQWMKGIEAGPIFSPLIPEPEPEGGLSP